MGLGTEIAVKVYCCQAILEGREDRAADNISVVSSWVSLRALQEKESWWCLWEALVCEDCSSVCETKQEYYLKGRTPRAMKQRGAANKIQWLNVQCHDVRSCKQIDLLIKGCIERRLEGRVLNAQQKCSPVLQQGSCWRFFNLAEKGITRWLQIEVR